MPSAAQNLACDEALLDAAEAGEAGEILRVWEPREYFVVLGYGNRAEAEVNLAYCRQNRIPVLRRCSGGGTVLQGPGAVNYAVIVRTTESGSCHSIAAANRFIMGRHQAALSTLLGQSVEVSGCTDLSVRGLKFSGNAQRRKRNYLLFHGCFLLNFDLALMERVLPLPSRQPDYRGGRSHSAFLMNLSLQPADLKSLLRETWAASRPLAEAPARQIAGLVQEKYGREEWNLRF
jgi:lipoate---protein ligase